MNIEIKKLYKNYGDKVIFKNFDLTFEKNTITCVLGGSGSGKTTLLNILSGLTEFSGDVTISNEISYLFQEQRLIPHLSVYENLDYVLKSVMPDKILRNETIIKSLQLVNLYDERNTFIHELSGGMARKVALIRAFVFPSKVLLMDEPFKEQDLKNKSKLISEFLSLYNTANKTVVLVTHDIYEALLVSDRIIVFDNNPIQIVFDKKIGIDKTKRKVMSKDLSDIKEELFNLFTLN